MRSTNVDEQLALIAAATVGGPAMDARPALHIIDGVPTYRLTVLGTTDLHGHALDWDYFAASRHADAAGNEIGLAKAARLIEAVRAVRGPENCVTIDAGDTIQGTPLVHQAGSAGGAHPMAAAMNAVGYDAATLGNHEFNFGLDALRAFADQLDHPLLGANALNWDDDAPAFPPSTVLTVPVPGHEPVRVGVLGLVTPGVAEWDRPRVAGRVRFVDLVEAASRFVPGLRESCDVVLVASHSGMAGASTYPDDVAPPENVSARVAAQVPGIDAMLVGHAHTEIVAHYVVNEQTGARVLLTEPLYWGMRVSVIDIVLEWRGAWQVVETSATMLSASGVDEDERVLAAVRPAHEGVLAAMDAVVAHTTGELATGCGRRGASPVTTLINDAQAAAVASSLVGTAFEGWPVLSATSPVADDVRLEAGPVTAREVAALCPSGVTLIGVAVTGAQLAQYLEWSAGRLVECDVAGFDVVGALEYEVDLQRPAGERVSGIARAGVPVCADDRFVLAITNHRQAGEGDYPGIGALPVATHVQVDVRHIVIEWAQGLGSVDIEALTCPGWVLADDPQQAASKNVSGGF